MAGQSDPLHLKKAVLYEVKWPKGSQGVPQKVPGADVTVQFNPQTLKLTYANENKSAGQPAGSASQYVGYGTTKLAVELLFDTSQTETDVRYWSAKVGYFLGAKDQPNQNNKKVPPGICFEWGTFSFAGVVDSMQETLDYFSESGKPLRATIALGISRLDIVFPKNLPKPGAATPAGQPGTTKLTPTPKGKSVPQLAGDNGNSANWKSVAAANNIDDPLHLPAGALLDLDAGASVGVGASVGAGAAAAASADVGFSAGLGGGVGFSSGVSAGIGGGISAGAGAGIGISGGIGASASAGLGASGGIGISGGVGASAGFGASAGIGASIGAGAGIGASAGIGARANAAGSAGGSFGIGAAAGASAGAGVRAG